MHEIEVCCASSVPDAALAESGYEDRERGGERQEGGGISRKGI
ncbi:MAG: hypothetical protein SFT91_04985 [Rickettsiaceae bacterium]|nr:hypothetical protein [Rickettsiaceae bacterium]